MHAAVIVSKSSSFTKTWIEKGCGICELGSSSSSAKEPSSRHIFKPARVKSPTPQTFRIPFQHAKDPAMFPKHIALLA